MATENLQGIADRDAGTAGEALRQEAERLGLVVAPSGCVVEDGAARPLGLSKATLKRRRLEARPIAPCPRFLGRWHYALADLAEISPEEVENGDV